ncbi:MAG: sugar ABC transporter substrate-binding protein [Clostridiales bacterium]|nr:sugar ABC transporter substrate-binding protein [Clostridiales bacterium]
MKKKRWLWTLLVLLIILLCLGSRYGGREKDGVTVGLLASEFSNEFMIAMQSGFVDRAEELGFQVVMKISGSHTETQLNQLQDLLVQDVDALAIRVNNETGGRELLEAAAEANVPVFLYDTKPSTDKYVSLITTDNYEIGCIAARAMGERMEKKKQKTEGGKIVVFSGSERLSTHSDRANGFLDTIAEEFPEIEVAEVCKTFRSEDTLDTAQDILSKYGEELDGVYLVTDYMTTVVLEAIERAGYEAWTEEKEGMIIIGTDGNPDMIQALREGRISGDVSQNAERLGADTAEIIARYLSGRSVEDEYQIPTMLITPENVDSPKVRRFGLWADSYEEKYGNRKDK